MADETSKTITVEEAIRLKNVLDQSITYGGLNAKEIKEMEKLTDEQYCELNRQIKDLGKSWWFFPDYFWGLGIIVACVCFFYFYQIYIRVVAVLVLVYCTGQLSYRAGILYGYVRGYQSGHEAGVHKALGVASEDTAELHQRAIEMEMDENLIKTMDEKK